MADIRHMAVGEEAQVADMLAEAFLEGPIADWLIPERTTRLEVYRKYFRIFVDHIGVHGVIHVTEDLSGAALWLDETAEGGSPEIENYDRLLAEAGGHWAHRLTMIDDTFARVHPHDPHWYLMFIGVLPSKHGRGAGSALLDFGHQAFGEFAAYLEASNERNKALYERHGYKPMTTRGVMLPDNGPPVWPMWRKPRTWHKPS